jgi:hypothetical protein
MTQGSPLVRIDSIELSDGFKLQLQGISTEQQIRKINPGRQALVTLVCVGCAGTWAFEKIPGREPGSCTWRFTVATTAPTRTKETERDFRNITESLRIEP